MLVLFPGGLWSGHLRAETAGLGTESSFSGRIVNVAEISLRPVSLGRFIAFIEAETGLPVIYPTGVLPMQATITIDPTMRPSLAQLFAQAAAQANVVFEPGDEKIVARLAVPSPSPAKTISVPAAAQVSAPTSVQPPIQAAPDVAVATVSTAEVVNDVSQIAAKTSLSRDKKEKAIAAAVRRAVIAAAAQKSRPAEVVSAAADIAEASAGAAPEFVETIALAAGFTPAVKYVSGGPAQVRSAAYAGARGPKSGAPLPVEPKVSAVGLRENPAAVEPVASPTAGFDAASRPVASSAPTTFFIAESSPTAAGTGAADAPAAETPASENPATKPAVTTIGGVEVAPLQIPVGETTAQSGAPGTDGVVRMERFSVSDAVVKGSTSDLKSERAKASVAIDFLSADQLMKYSAGDLSEVVFRIPGVSVAQGQFAVVRGLSDRFLSTTLQGVKLPTPDPEKQAVQLDLIPASAVEAVVVSKTFQSSMWAESSGGNMDVRTRAIPTEGMFKVSFGLKVNSNAANGGPDYPNGGGKDERFGFGSRSRLAAGTSDRTWQYVPTPRSSFPAGNKLSMEFARAFNFGDQQLGVLVNAFSEAGNKAKSGDKQAFGAQAGRPPRAAVPATGNRPAVAADPGMPSDFEKGLPTAPYAKYEYTESEKENILSATTAIGFRFSPEHEVKLTGLFVQSGIDMAQLSGTSVVQDPATKLPVPVSGLGGFTGAEDYAWFKSYEYFRERNLTVAQLSGRHSFPRMGDVKVNWSAQRGASYEKQSPFAEANFATPLTNLSKTYAGVGGSDAPQSLKVLWADNQEKLKTARIDVDWPFRLWGEQPSTLSIGAALDSTDRETSGATIDYRLNSAGTQTAATPNGVFAKIVGSQSGIATPPTTAAREVKAYYFGTNIALLENLKLVAGARYEDFTLSSTGSGRWGGNLTSASFYGNSPAKVLLGALPKDNPPFTDQKWYPGVGLIYTPVKGVTARLHYSKTTGRPSLREVSPFFNKSIETDNLVTGNPALKPSDATNQDVRVEWAPNRTDFIAVSVFRKEIERPIEKFIFTQTVPAVGENTESWLNNPGTARLRGFELEFRHQFKTWSNALRDFSLAGNFTHISATVPEIPAVLTNLLGGYQNAAKIPLQRRLFDQPERIANVDLTWSRPTWGTSVTLAAFAISDVLVGTGKPTFFDLYERFYTRLDLVFNQQISSRLKLKLTVKNLADPARGLIYDREATTALIERNTYHAGRDYSATVTYDF